MRVLAMKQEKTKKKFKVKIGTFGFIVLATSPKAAVTMFVRKYVELGYRRDLVAFNDRDRKLFRSGRFGVTRLYKPKGCKAIGPDVVVIKAIAVSKHFDSK